MSDFKLKLRKILRLAWAQFYKTFRGKMNNFAQ